MISVHKTNLSDALLAGAFHLIFRVSGLKTCRINKWDNKGENYEKQLIYIHIIYILYILYLYHMTVITVLLLVTTTQLKETVETVEENDHMWHGICCYVTRRRRARGVNQQRHVSKGASPAHSPEVARRGQCFKTMQLLSSLRDRNQPVFTSHTDDAV